MNNFKEIRGLKMIDIPLGLRQALESGDCILFIGAGIGYHMFDEKGNNAPDGKTLAKDMAKHFGVNAGDLDDLAKISQYVEIKHGRTEMETYIKKRLVHLQPDDNFKWLSNIRWKAIYTTNYDNCIQKAYDSNPNPLQEYLTITSNSELIQYDTRFQVPVFHLHGTLFSAEKPHIIITEKDYTKYKDRRKMMFNQLKIHIATSNILYIGYSNNDNNWKTIISEINEEFYPGEMPYSYRVDPFTSDIDIEILKNSNIETVKCYFNEFAETSQLLLKELKVDSLKIKKIQSNIPTDLLPAFEKNPAATVRLLSSWEYINQASFNEKPNIYNFLRGEKPNWSLIAKEQYFVRDIEEEAYESLIDYATSLSNKPCTSIVLGSAGYGITTMLMTLATKLIKDRAGYVFFLKPNRELREGDVEFANSIFGGKTFFFIDNAADNSEMIQMIYKKYNDANKSCMFVLGERRNEWRQATPRIKGNVYVTAPLSDGEIERLIDCLAQNKELNKLEHLDRDIQISAIKKNYLRELLVVIREATEGNSFDAIIEDEFRGIKDEMSKNLYLAVCCFYQHGAFVRDNVLAEILNTSIVELYNKTRDNTEGIIVFECIDDEKGIFVARARHRIISAIVWERCGEQGEKQRIIQEALASLNLYYKTDKDAFESFIRSDRLIDTIKDLDGKIKFFDKACNKDPDNPYIRQHYARMLLRESKSLLALSQIDEAIKLNPDTRVLYHTKGLILSSMALNDDSEEIRRKRLSQSEASFKQSLRMHEKDEYSYQGLAQLYLGWAKLSKQEDEKIEYITKAENIINEGLKKVRVGESLWIESANIQNFLGDQPSRIKDLERAVKDTPGSIISRYLLGRAYSQNGSYDKSIDILKPIIINNPEEYRPFIEYALSIIYLGKPYKEAIAVLNQSTLYGFSDPRYIATLGGLLFLDKQFSESERIFAEYLKRDINGIELHKIFFRPPDPNNSSEYLRIKGTVKMVRAGYSIIETAEFPEFLCPGSKYYGLAMKEKMNITFVPAFTAKKRIADKPEIIN